MRHESANRTASTGDRDPISELVRQIGRLLRHRAFERAKVVSPLLLRHLPPDAGYAWQGEAALRSRLAGAGLDAKSLAYLTANVQLELERIRERISV